MQLEILFEDQNYVAVQKPPGLLVHRTQIDRHDKNAVVQILRNQLKQKIFPVHRLDKPTSGVLILARTSEAAQKLAVHFNQQQVEKKYWAITRGHFKEAKLIDHPLKTDIDGKQDGELVATKPAQTFLRPLSLVERPIEIDRYPTSRFSLVEARPQTGRTHQIRKHLKHIHHPIIGDVNFGNGKYNRYFSEELEIKGLMLSCVELSFCHPFSGDRVVIKSKLPGHFSLAIKVLGFDLKGNSD